MSLNDKILETCKKHGSLSTDDITRILKEKYGIDKSNRVVQRHIKQLIEHENRLAPDKPKGRKQTYSLPKTPRVPHKSFFQRLVLVREIYGLILIMVFLLFSTIAFTPRLISISQNATLMSEWNFTGHEVARIVFPLTPYLIISVVVITLICLGIDITKIFRKIMVRLKLHA